MDSKEANDSKESFQNPEQMYIYEPGFIVMLGPETKSKVLMSRKLAENNRYIDLAKFTEFKVELPDPKDHTLTLGKDTPQFNIKMVLFNFDPSHEPFVERMVNDAKISRHSIVLLCQELESLSKSLRAKVNYAFIDVTPNSNNHRWEMFAYVHDDSKKKRKKKKKRNKNKNKNQMTKQHDDSDTKENQTE